jgi:hypothetical protein
MLTTSGNVVPGTWHDAGTARGALLPPRKCHQTRIYRSNINDTLDRRSIAIPGVLLSACLYAARRKISCPRASAMTPSPDEASRVDRMSDVLAPPIPVNARSIS